MEIIIESVEGNEKAMTKVIKGGELRPGKGFNLQPHPFIQNQLSERDVEIVEQLKNVKENLMKMKLKTCENTLI